MCSSGNKRCQATGRKSESGYGSATRPTFVSWFDENIKYFSMPGARSRDAFDLQLIQSMLETGLSPKNNQNIVHCLMYTLPTA
jgi:hypothetical protein